MCFTMGDTSETWLGTSLSDLYQGEGPWAFSTPPLSPSSYHHVLFKQPITLSEPPEPFCDSKPSNSEDYVVLPYSPDSLYLVVQDGKEIIRQRWEVICESLLKPINTLEELEIAMNSYNNNKLWKFTALQHFFNNVSFKKTLKTIKSGNFRFCKKMNQSSSLQKYSRILYNWL